MMSLPMPHRFAVTTCWLALALACGCATDATLLSDAPPAEAALSSLSAAERELLCAERLAPGAFGDELHHAYCLAVRYGATECDEGYRTCMQQGLADTCDGFECWHPAIAEGDDPSPLCDAARLGACAATVDQWRECVDDAEHALLDTFTDRSCTDGLDDDREVAYGLAGAALMPASCEALLEQCPGLASRSLLGLSDACEFEIRTRGAVEAHLTTLGGDCSESRPPASSGDRRIGLGGSPPGEGAPVTGLTVLTLPLTANVVAEAEPVGLSVAGQAGLWTTSDGCTADIETLECTERFSNRIVFGVVYRITNGRCSVPLAALHDPGAESLEVMEFSGTSVCTLP